MVCATFLTVSVVTAIFGSQAEIVRPDTLGLSLCTMALVQYLSNTEHCGGGSRAQVESAYLADVV